MLQKKINNTLNDFVDLVNSDLELQKAIDKYDISSHYDLLAVIESLTDPDGVLILEIIEVD